MNGEQDPYEMIVAHLNEIREQVKEFEGLQTGPFIVIELRNIADELRENTRALYAIAKAIRHSKGDMTAEEEAAFRNQVNAGLDRVTEKLKPATPSPDLVPA